MALAIDMQVFTVPRAGDTALPSAPRPCWSQSSHQHSSRRAARAVLAACLAWPGSQLLSWLGDRRHRKARIRAQLVQRDTALSRDVSRWKLAAQGTPFAEDDPDGQLRQQVEDLWQDLEPKLMYLPRDDRLQALSGLCVAALAHKGQKRKSGEPYIVHPVAVAELLAQLKVPVEVIVSGLLHDTVEDNDEIRFEDLESIFGVDARRTLA
ncbi:Putative GTP diphosphokinase RSH1, partial [Durusdinium trenchii]